MAVAVRALHNSKYSFNCISFRINLERKKKFPKIGPASPLDKKKSFNKCVEKKTPISYQQFFGEHVNKMILCIYRQTNLDLQSRLVSIIMY